MSQLFEPLTLRTVTLPNRIAVSPMCQYSSTDGLPDDWHLVHLGSRAVGGAGLVMTEAAAVVPEGRISPHDAGLWSDEQEHAWSRITAFLDANGAVPAVQLAHAGNKGSTHRPWSPLRGAVADVDGGWPVVGPTEVPFTDDYPVPSALDQSGIDDVVTAFADAARRAVRAGFRVVEVHAAHGYLLHEFLSPLINTRTDGYGGSVQNRLRLPRDVVVAVREAVGPDVPVWVRISASDWTDGGLTGDDAVTIARAFADDGADLIDVSSGGAVPSADVFLRPGYQVPLAAQIRAQAGVPVGAVGLITDPAHADELVETGQADVVLLGRELLRDPYWPRRAAAALGANDALSAPVQYRNAW